jgi:hypothetical protein
MKKIFIYLLLHGALLMPVVDPPVSMPHSAKARKSQSHHSIQFIHVKELRMYPFNPRGPMRKSCIVGGGGGGHHHIFFFVAADLISIRQLSISVRNLFAHYSEHLFFELFGGCYKMLFLICFVHLQRGVLTSHFPFFRVGKRPASPQQNLVSITPVNLKFWNSFT